MVRVEPWAAPFLENSRSGEIIYRDIFKTSHPQSDVEQTTAYRAISISSHMVGFSGHCEKKSVLKMENDEMWWKMCLKMESSSFGFSFWMEFLRFRVPWWSPLISMFLFTLADIFWACVPVLGRVPWWLGKTKKTKNWENNCWIQFTRTFCRFLIWSLCDNRILRVQCRRSHRDLNFGL